MLAIRLQLHRHCSTFACTKRRGENPNQPRVKARRGCEHGHLLKPIAMLVLVVAQVSTAQHGLAQAVLSHCWSAQDAVPPISVAFALGRVWMLHEARRSLERVSPAAPRYITSFG